MDPAAFMLAAVLLGAPLSLLWVEYHRRRDDRLYKQRMCLHTWQWMSAFNEGQYWNRKCVKCGKQEPCKFNGDDA